MVRMMHGTQAARCRITGCHLRVAGHGTLAFMRLVIMAIMCSVVSPVAHGVVGHERIFYLTGKVRSALLPISGSPVH